MPEKEVGIWSTADLLGGKSHGEADLRRTMHTNGIITDMTGGLLGRSGATPQLPRPPLAGLWLTCSSYLGIRDNRLHFCGKCWMYLVLFLSWHDIVFVFCGSLRRFVWQSQRHFLWKVTLRIETFQALTANSLRYDKRLWSLYRNMKEAGMSPRWKGIWHEKRHRYSIVYNTRERARLQNCEKRSSANVCAVPPVELAKMLICRR